VQEHTVTPNLHYQAAAAAVEQLGGKHQRGVEDTGKPSLQSSPKPPTAHHALKQPAKSLKREVTLSPAQKPGTKTCNGELQ
jgi:hypothetical protein